MKNIPPPHYRAMAQSTKIVKCKDGPFKGASLYLTQDKVTLPFILKGTAGFYRGGKFNAIS